MTGLPSVSGPALHLRDIGKAFGQTRVLEGIDLAVGQGEFIALVGPSGCGKSTLLRIAAGLEPPDRGEVLLHGRDVTAVRAADRDMAMVFQSYALYPHLTTRQNMGLPLVMRRLSALERLPLATLRPGVRAKLAAIRSEVESAAAMLKITVVSALVVEIRCQRRCRQRWPSDRLAKVELRRFPPRPRGPDDRR